MFPKPYISTPKMKTAAKSKNPNPAQASPGTPAKRAFTLI